MINNMFKTNIYNKIIIIFFSIFIFFFDFLRYYFDFRLIIFIPLFLAFFEFIYLKKKVNYYLITIFLSLLSLLILQSQFQEINFKDKIYSFKSIIFLGISIFSIWYFSESIIKNIGLIFNFFLIFFFLYIIFYTIFRFDMHLENHQCYIGCFSVLNDKFEFFKENSHLGFISSTLIAFMIIKVKKINFYLVSLFIFYVLLILNFSLTIFSTIFFILSYFIIFYFKKFNIIQKFLIFLIIASSFYSLKVNSGAIDRLYNLINFDNWKVKSNPELFKENKKNINIENKKSKINKVENASKKNNENKKQKENQQKNIQVKNLSSEVFIVSLNIAKLSILEKPFGYGLNNYHLAFKKHIDNILVTNQITKRLNVFDASNNLAKMITELGIFSLLIFFIILKFLLSKKIPHEYKLIIFPSLFTQIFIRGAGYFNGGFIFFLVLSCYLLYKFKD